MWQNDTPGIYAGLTRGFGLRSDDSGDVMTAYLMLGNRPSAPSTSQMKAARCQIGRLLAQGACTGDDLNRVILDAQGFGPRD